MSALALTALRHSMVGKPVRITFGRYNQQRGVVLDIFHRDAVRSQDMAMVKLNDGRIVSGVPVKDLEVFG